MPIKVKALTFSQPWASLIIASAKHWEIRNWGTNYSGLLVIHAGKTNETDTTNRIFMTHLIAAGLGDWINLPRSAAVGVVWLNKCYKGRSVLPYIDEQEKTFGNFDGDDRVAWELTNPVAFEPPIPMRGKQGLRDWPLPLPDDVLELFQHVL